MVFLYVVDGMFYDEELVNVLNFVDIESMFILKDVVFVVFYGLCVVNGVVMIIIKKGMVDKFKVIFDVCWGVNICGVLEYDIMKD